jgi:4'-phosphopantetheinyl transferase
MNESQDKINYQNLSSPKGKIIYWFAQPPANFKAAGLTKKQWETAAINDMLRKQGFAKARITHQTSGQPELSDCKMTHISISHSKGWFAVYLAQEKIGIDIEVHKSAINDGSSYFVNQNEMAFCKSSKDLHLIWGAKEAFYKKQAGKVQDLKNDVSITEICDRFIKVQYVDEVCLLEYKQIGQVYLVWTT